MQATKGIHMATQKVSMESIEEYLEQARKQLSTGLTQLSLMQNDLEGFFHRRREEKAKAEADEVKELEHEHENAKIGEGNISDEQLFELTLLNSQKTRWTRQDRQLLGALNELVRRRAGRGEFNEGMKAAAKAAFASDEAKPLYEIKTLKEKLGKAEKRIRDLGRVRVTLKVALNDLEDRHETLRVDLCSLKNERCNLEEDLATASETVRLQRLEINEACDLDPKYKQLKDRLRESEKELRLTEEQLCGSRNEVAKYKGDFQSTRDRLEKAILDGDQLRRDLNDLKEDRIAMYEEGISPLVSRITGLREELLKANNERFPIDETGIPQYWRIINAVVGLVGGIFKLGDKIEWLHSDCTTIAEAESPGPPAWLTLRVTREGVGTVEGRINLRHMSGHHDFDDQAKVILTGIALELRLGEDIADQAKKKLH